MVRLREIPRTAAFTWSPGSAAPLIATGTKSGAVTADFSNDTCLEVWDLALDNEQQGPELQPLAKFETDAGFHDLAWTQSEESHPRGVIAGGLETGSLDLWDAEKLLVQQGEARIEQMQKHSGAIKALQFNPKVSNLIATGGAKGELFVTDLNNVSQPMRLGSTAARADDIDCLDWNKKVAHIMVTGSSGGFVTVWDLKTKKESLSLNNMGRKAVSAVAWDPEKPTRLITATPLEQDPVILVWDLRNSNAPERTLRAHDSGVLSLSWCVQDSDLLLSCGKDNRTVLWNPQTGTPYGDYPVVTNWTFQTRWNPHNPNLFATASFDGKLAVQTLQNTGSASSQTISSQSQALDAEDFFSKAQTQPQAASFSLPKAPKWLERPVTVSFGFGGRIASVKPSGGSGARSSKVTISKYEADSGLGTSTEQFEKAMQVGDFKSICEAKISEAQSEEDKADWKIIGSLLASDSRSKLIDYLGLSNEADEAADGIAKLGASDDKDKSESEDLAAPQMNGTDNKHKRLSSMFNTGNDTDGDFLSDLAASKGAKTNSPFKIFTGLESEADRRITRALILGDFQKALDVCLEENRMSDAFMFAICGGEASIAKVQEAYFSKQRSGPNYLRLLASVVGKNLWDTVHNADPANWKEIMVTLCSFADHKEFPDLCEALGDRLEEQLKEESHLISRNDASFCYLVGSKLDRVVQIWIQELDDTETKNTASESGSSAYSIHAQGLQRLIEKVTVFRKVTNFQDAELRDASKSSDWKLDALYKKYLEYADIVAAHGQLQLAEQFLDLLPIKYPDADVARSRVKQASKKPTPEVSRGAQAATSTRAKPLPSINNFQPQSTTFSPVTQSSDTPYVPPASSQPPNSYAPPATAQPANLYVPAGGYQPAQPMGYQPPQSRGPGLAAPPPQNFGQTTGRLPVAPPPHSFNQSPSIRPPSQATHMSNWNDIPETFGKPPTSRRGTPGLGNQPISSPFPGQPSPTSQTGPPLAGSPYGARQRSTPPVPPPPKGAAPPPRVTSPLTSGQPQRPPSSATNAYIPSPSTAAPPPAPRGQNIVQPPVQRGPSPYNAPPPGPPSSNRYAPNPAQQHPGPPPPQQARQPVPPPPQASPYQSAPPPSNPYAPPRPQAAPPPSPYTPSVPSHQSAPPPAQIAPPPPTGSQPPGNVPPASRPSTGQSERRKVAAPSKHPTGDRTHIPPSATPIYTVLSSEMSRVKARAPAQYGPQVKDTEKRLNILFDHLNNEELLSRGTVAQMVELAEALQARDFERAGQIQMDVHREKVEECGNWMVGVKRLVGMCKATG